MFANRVNLGFDSAESLTAEHDITGLKADDSQQLVQLKYVKFQRVNSLAVRRLFPCQLASNCYRRSSL